MSLQGLSNIERNRYQPSAETIDRICKVFKIKPIELLAEHNSDSEEILKNINFLLTDCKKSKLKKIYNILSILLKI